MNRKRNCITIILIAILVVIHIYRIVDSDELEKFAHRAPENVHSRPSATNEERGSEARPVTTGESERVREDYFEFSEDIVARLQDKGYLDDQKFAQYYDKRYLVWVLADSELCKEKIPR